MKARDLLPDHPWVQLAVAQYYFRGLRDYETALMHLERARELHPNHTRVLLWTYYVQRRKGDLHAACKSIKRVHELDPLYAPFACDLGNILKVLRKYKEAEHYHELAIQQDPNNPEYYTQKAWLYLVWLGKPNEARKVLDEAATKIEITERERRLMVFIDICSGKYQDALDRLPQADDVEIEPTWDMPYALRRAEIYGYLDQNDLARQQYETALTALKAKLHEYPMSEYYHSSLGIAYAGLGDEPNAIKHGNRGIELLLKEKDVWNGPVRMEDLARIYVMVGKHEEAIDTLKELLEMPSRLSYKLVAIDPAWDPLRDHSYFQKLLKSNK
jgi:tetratricopeptide (TPR) repeat protein